MVAPTPLAALAAAPTVDSVQLNFSPSGLLLLNVVIGFVMYGVALSLKLEDFTRIVRDPKGPLIGLVAQFLLLPALTFGLTRLIDPAPSVALGMLLVAACPGGNMSNVVTHLARGNVALSVSMTAVSTCAAIVMTPLNLSFWGSMHPGTAAILREVALDPWSMLQTVGLILGVPLVLGVATSRRFPALALRMDKPVRRAGVVAMGVFIAGALAKNWAYFIDWIGLVMGLVALHNAAALALGYVAARAAGLPEADRRAVSVEVGIQNAGLGLVLIFGFFDGLGGMAVLTAWWGVWLMISGLGLAAWWGRRQPASSRLNKI
jgi:BASS family bile acid:Na+ symporter